MTKPHACLWLVVVAVLLFVVGTFPSAAHGEPAPPPAPQPKSHVNPDGTAVLYVYPKDLPMREGEEPLAPAPRPPENPLVKEPLSWA